MVVAVLKTSPNSVLDDYSTLMDLAQYSKYLPKDFTTLLKLNLSWSLYFPSCSSQPWQVEGVLRKLKNDEFSSIIPLENETVVTDTQKGVSFNKWGNIFEKYKTPFQSLTEVEWVKFKSKSNLLALYEIFEEGHEVPKMFFNTNVIHLPTMKCHGHTTMTGAMKNAFGGLITKKRHHCHKKIHEVLVDLLTLQKEIHKGIFAIMDGSVCGAGAGPRTMFPIEKNYLLASNDQVAIDAISAKMMGFDPLSIDFIRIAHDLGLGCGDIDQIEIVGETISKVNFGFKTKKSPVIFFDQLLRKGALSFLEPYLFHGPLFNLCIFGSGFYHDKIWYPLIGKKRITDFEKSGWGKLFNSYK